ncbi:MAG TPA: Flp pilus assembly protein CpaB, partial [Intrasporangium sp.]|nr:Flp pilus assembly protein CpaB [Intrasporangium sp.]
MIAILVAVLLATGGAALVMMYANSADARAIADEQPTSVWVAQKLVPAGTTLKDAQRTELIAQTQVAARGVPVGALRAIDADNSALLALSDVQPGEFLLSARFGTTPVGTKAIEVPSGKLAVSVELTDAARVGKFVTPGSRIAIYSSY